MKAISLSVIARFTLLGAVLVALSIGFAHAQGSGDESNLRDLAGRASGYTAEVRELLARGVNPNVPDSRGRTAVHAAAGIGAVATLEALLQAYGDSDAQDTDGNTPLHLAADASSSVLSEERFHRHHPVAAGPPSGAEPSQPKRRDPAPPRRPQP